MFTEKQDEHTYRIRIDNLVYTFKTNHTLAEQLLNLAGDVDGHACMHDRRLRAMVYILTSVVDVPLSGYM